MTAPTPQHAEPVAYMLRTGHGTKLVEVKPPVEYEWDGKNPWVPLYAHPVAAPDTWTGEQVTAIWNAGIQCVLDMPQRERSTRNISALLRSVAHPVAAKPTGSYPYPGGVKVSEFESSGFQPKREAPKPTDVQLWIDKLMGNDVLSSEYPQIAQLIHALQTQLEQCTKPAFDIDEAMRLADEYANWEPVERDTNWHAERAALEAYLKAHT